MSENDYNYLFDGLDSNFFCNGKGLLITVSFPSSSEEDGEEELEDPEEDGSLYKKRAKLLLRDRGKSRSITGWGFFSYLCIRSISFMMLKIKITTRI